MKKCEYCGKVLNKMAEQEPPKDDMIEESEEEESPEEEVEIKIVSAGNSKMGDSVKTLGDIAERFFKKSR